ncbi:hypothetical protein ASZ78_001966 [Callipepla squamata]|uniref:Uncharacterized protein n=1 Tax=Callipepla squamata TaxID=9009 RepID=A0A226MUK8_CALSU|nr:hypothetical protein ASZ78_001966 [Callipepla squamata]
MEFLKSQLADCQERLHKLDWMEDKLRVLEERLKGKVIIDEKDWNNLLSRVLLLETELLLQSKKSKDVFDVWLKCSELVFQRDLSAEFSSVNQDGTSSVIPVSPEATFLDDLFGIYLVCVMPNLLHFLLFYESRKTILSPYKLKVHLKNVDFEEFTKLVAFKLQETTRQRMERISKM